jgi:cytochrome d ubiquinol oxidase subunit I
VWRRRSWLSNKIILWAGMLTIPIVYVCSQAGWVTAEVGRQPWIIQDIMPVQAAISDIPVSTVMLTFWLFAAMFTAFLAAEVGIMLRQIAKGSKSDYESLKD